MGKTNTNIKHTVGGTNYAIYHEDTLKNPLAGFFIEIEGKKKKLKLADLNPEKANQLKSLLKNAAKPPPGKKLNPLTGRFVKIGGATNAKINPKTFQDPISLATMKKTDGVELNKVWYGKSGLREWVDSGKNTIPHSRRKLTDAEIKNVFTGKNGQQIAKKRASPVRSNRNNNNSNRNNNNNFTTEFDFVDMNQNIDEGGQKNFSTFTEFKTYINRLYDEMESNEIGAIIDKKIKIADRPGVEMILNVERRGTMDARGRVLSSWIDVFVTVTRRNTNVSTSAEELNINMARKTPESLLRQVNTATR
jgi:hypothetical protein